MLCYRAEIRVESGVPEFKDYNEGRQYTKAIQRKTKSFNSNEGKNKYYFISNADPEECIIGIIADHREDVGKGLDEYLDHIGVKASKISIAEVTLDVINEMLDISRSDRYTTNPDVIRHAYGLYIGDGWSSISYDEHILKDIKKEELYRAAESFLLEDTLVPEYQRIYAYHPEKRTLGHPVQYMIMTDSTAAMTASYEGLLSALYENGRIAGRRFSFVSCSPESNMKEACLNRLYKASVGCTIVIRYEADSEGDSDCATAGAEKINMICRMMKEYSRQVLTILILPRESAKLRSAIYRQLGSIAMVEIKESLAGKETSAKLLDKMAEENELVPDETLYQGLEEKKKYLSHELKGMFDEWHMVQLRTKVYPQYRDIHSARKEVVEAPHEGMGYDELMDLTGLTSAKDVINKALNFYKLQKLFADKGIKQNRPAMHMLFTGNPGTAKTTVARLFARIMKENDLLDLGHMVEVGRGDLVGRYVGWTAKIVKEKFNKAKGGVLFIDEAYSLVDDRDGSFGDEAINTIVQEMENHRDDVVVIFAGYPDKMEDFLHKNPGLRSRIAFHVPFADYSADELVQITKQMAEKSGFTITREAAGKLHDTFAAVIGQDDFGNGRYARNILEQARMSLADRLIKCDPDRITVTDLTTITAEDIVIPERKTPEKRRIGFCA